MQLWARGTSRLGLASLGMMGACAIAGLVSGFAPEAGQTSELSPAETVALRFPSGWEKSAESTATPLSGPSSQPAELLETRNAIQSPVSSIFNPYPIYTLASATSEPIRVPEQALGYADVRSESTAAIQAAPISTERRVPARAKEPSGLFNGAQLASIKQRLQLSPQQEQLWPPVEAALRTIGYRYNHTRSARKGETRTAVIAPTSEEVQRLKSAAVPLIMTMREDQKREVRSLAHLLGLEQLAAQF